MTTLKSCSIDDQYKHVSFKDLDGYLRKDDYLAGYCEAEKELVRKNLGIEVYKVDSKMSDLSTNPVENQAITHALKCKADINKLPKVAITGDYCDLHRKPMHLPNPEFLVIDGADGTVGYNGSAPLKIKLPTHTSELVNDVGFLTDETLLQAGFVKGIRTNDSDIIWPEQGIITLDISELTGIDHELSLTSHRPVENRVITRVLKNLQGAIPKKLNDLTDVTDANAPTNGQVLVYVKPNDDCEGYWKPVGQPTAGDFLIFNGTSWETTNFEQEVKKYAPCLWTISNHKLVPNVNEIVERYGQYEGVVATEGSIHSGQGSTY